ncbi:MAG: hypothetical protein NTY03_01475 [Candidatus Bathyarchaeota archaeon]|nr:hypothetical protein [Candidatus Bathyarchaeota archaeon]
MKRPTASIISSMFLFVPLLVSREQIQPYIDAGTSSIIIQAVIGGLFAGLVALKIFWGRVSTFFKNLFSRGKKDEESGQ